MVAVWFMFLIIIAIVFVVLKVVMKKQAIATKLAFFLFIIIMLSVGYVYTVSGTKIKTSEDVASFTEVYLSWVFSTFKNTKSITSSTISNFAEKDWGLNNSTSFKGS